MSDTQTIDDYAILTEPTTLFIRRVLPGPVERVFDYLTKAELRRQWLADGEMELKPGAPFAFTWKNSELTDPPGTPPEGMTGEHRMESRIIAVDPPRMLRFGWGSEGEVLIELTPRGREVVLNVTHTRLDDPASRAAVAPGWHAHLDLLAKRLENATPEPFWDAFRRIRAEYQKRLG